MNKLTIIGNLTRDPETRPVGENTVCNFTVAVNRRKTRNNQNPEADYFRVSAWGELGNNCQKYLTKGRKVAVVGPVSVHAFAAQDGTPKGSLEVKADEVEFLSSGNSGEQSGSAPAPAEEQGGFSKVETDELPF